MTAQQKIVFIVIFVCCTCSFVSCDEGDVTSSDTNVAEGRTFGHHFLKRISFAIIPAAFVVGVITTLLAALTVVSLKGLGIGVILLILAVGQILSRSLAQTHAAAYSAPVPIVYSHHRDYTSSPVWVEKDW